MTNVAVAVFNTHSSHIEPTFWKFWTNICPFHLTDYSIYVILDGLKMTREHSLLANICHFSESG
jgi:hypothetical protein